MLIESLFMGYEYLFVPHIYVYHDTQQRILLWIFRLSDKKKKNQCSVKAKIVLDKVKQARKVLFKAIVIEKRGQNSVFTICHRNKGLESF